MRRATLSVLALVLMVLMEHTSAAHDAADNGKSVELIRYEEILAEQRQLGHQIQQLYALLISLSDGRKRFVAAAEQVQAAVDSLQPLATTYAGDPAFEPFVRPSAIDAPQG